MATFGRPRPSANTDLRPTATEIVECRRAVEATVTDREPGVLAAAGLVGGGSFAGALARHAVTLAAPTTALGTLGVNVFGSFLLGVVLSDTGLGRRLSSRLRLLLATGVLSSFTTYSTFALATTELSPSLAVGYVGANYGLAIAAVLLAHALARWLS